MTTVLFVRHGEIENPENVVPLRLPGFPLSAVGREKIQKLAEKFANKNIAAVYCSPILRCRQTAEILASRLGLKVVVDERLIELLSPFQGMGKREFTRMLGEKSIYRFAEQLEKGEKPEEVVARMRQFLDEILEKHKGANVIAVSHGDPIMALVYDLTAKDPYSVREGRVGYLLKGSYFELKFDGKKLVDQRLILP